MITDRFLPNAIESATWIPRKPALREQVAKWAQSELLVPFLSILVNEVEQLLLIDPGLNEREILQEYTGHMVRFLSAQSGSVRIFDPHTGHLLSYGSYPSEESVRQRYLPVSGTIAGEVMRTKQLYIAKDLLVEDRFQQKEIAFRKGAFSLMAIPFEIPRYRSGERETIGVIQLYFKEKGREFTELEVLLAELLARRLGLVMAQRKIYLYQKAREKRELISDIIIRSSGTRGGLKLKEVFLTAVPHLKDIMDIQMCALLSTDNEIQNAVVEAVYPEAKWMYSPGQSFAIHTDKALQILLNLQKYEGPSFSEVVTPWYILIVDPEKSDIMGENTRAFALENRLNSLLYIPMSLDSQSPYFLVFATKEERIRYSEDEIDILLHLGRELVKAERMERLDDALHDFKNPAIAIAGFARRLKRLAEKDTAQNKDQILRYADILVEETSRLQELALSIYQVGNEEMVDISQVLKKRFEINKEAIKQQLKQNISLKEGPFDESLLVLCYPMNLERVFDNVLNNATKAIPMEGGFLGVSTFREGEWACAEIRNSGTIPQAEISALKDGYGSGRGLYITYRIVKLMNGKMDITVKDSYTSFIIKFPNQATPLNKWVGPQGGPVVG